MYEAAEQNNTPYLIISSYHLFSQMGECQIQVQIF